MAAAERLVLSWELVSFAQERQIAGHTIREIQYMTPQTLINLLSMRWRIFFCSSGENSTSKLLCEPSLPVYSTSSAYSASTAAFSGWPLLAIDEVMVCSAGWINNGKERRQKMNKDKVAHQAKTDMVCIPLAKQFLDFDVVERNRGWR